MLLSVTMNPCIDKMVMIPSFVYGGLNRIENSRCDFSGKGINVSKVYRAIGGNTICTGLNYSQNGGELEAALEAIGIGFQFVSVQGSVRINTKVFDRQSCVVTELNEKGTAVDAGEVEALLALIGKLAGEGDICVIGGSVPPGVEKEIYRRIIRLMQAKGVKTALDADGELYRYGLDAQPAFLKPNLFELNTYFGSEFKTLKEIAGAARTFTEKGAEFVLVTLGADGALIVTERGCLFAPALKVEVRGTAGAGDSALAGALRAYELGLSDAEVLAYSTAAAAGSVRREGTLLCRSEDLEELLPLVKTERIHL